MKTFIDIIEILGSKVISHSHNAELCENHIIKQLNSLRYWTTGEKIAYKDKVQFIFHLEDYLCKSVRTLNTAKQHSSITYSKIRNLIDSVNKKIALMDLKDSSSIITQVYSLQATSKSMN